VRILYRVRQFWHALLLKTDPVELEQAQKILNPEQWTLFAQLQTGEAAHSLALCRKLRDQGENDPDLLTAALLHDIGKLNYPMNPIERALVVMVRTVSPGRARQWGSLPPGGWESAPSLRKPFIVKQQHAEWGAEMARKAGASELTQQLIRQHHWAPDPVSETMEKHLHYQLWRVDNES
jgi:putative nucleotidyltransferase with HDIG domain